MIAIETTDQNQAAQPDSKKWYQSKMLIINGLVTILAALQATTGMLQPALGSNKAFLIVTIVLGALNSVLRLFTSKPIAKKKAQ